MSNVILCTICWNSTKVKDRSHPSIEARKLASIMQARTSSKGTVPVWVKTRSRYGKARVKDEGSNVEPAPVKPLVLCPEIRGLHRGQCCR